MPTLSVLLPPPVGELVLETDVLEAGPGGALWDGAVALAQHLAASYGEGAQLSGTHVVELGAGCGLPGLAAARLGAASVALTDRPRCLPLLRRNAAANGLQARVGVVELEWGSRGAARLLGDAGDDRGRTLVLCAECVAHQEGFEPLLLTLRALLRGGGDAALLCGKRRSSEEESFWGEARRLFRVELLAEGTSPLDRDGDGLPIALHRLTRAAVDTA